jgi:L-ribulose-5-phosphate 3-epimerase
VKHRLGVCSWSLQPESPTHLVERIRACGLEFVQLALDPIRELDADWRMVSSMKAFEAGGVTAVSGMMAMRGEDYSTLQTIRDTGGLLQDDHWDANRGAAMQNARIAQELKIPIVSFHAGFLPPKSDPEMREEVIDRLRLVVDIFRAHGSQIALETGQESAQQLLEFLKEVDRKDVLGINFDPANMILYNQGDPVEALKLLLPHVRQCHIKDAMLTETEGEWGTEVPVGTGQVDWSAFFEILNSKQGKMDLIIECEAGDNRIQDVIRARDLVNSFLQ